MNPDTFEYVLYQLFNHPPITYPFKHLYVEKIFPEQFYKDIIINLPETSQYESISKSDRVARGSYVERLRFPLINDTMKQLPDNKRSFWQQFMQTFGGDAFQKATIQLFNDVITKRFEKSRVKPEFETVIDLIRDTTAYSIGPHTDTPLKLLSLLFYLPKDDTRPNIGTSLFAPRNTFIQSDQQGIHHTFNEFKLITTMPFMPNTVFGFARTDSSWHGVTPISEEKIERDSIQLQIQISNFGDL